MAPTGHRTVVGYNGTPSARAALEWAAVDARNRHSELLILHAEEWVRAGRVSATSPARSGGDPLVALNVIDDAYARVRQVAPDLIVTAESGLAGVRRSLVESSCTADLVVLGAPEDPGLPGPALGCRHTSAAVVARARCPVVLVGPGHAGDVHSSLPIAVGFDGSCGAERALGFAAERAARSRIRLLVVVAYSDLAAPAQVANSTGVEKDGKPVFGTDASYAAAELAVSAVARVRRSFPDLEIDFETVEGQALDALAGRSGRCSMIVVGNRGRGLSGSLLGQSLGHALITRAHSILAVVH